MCERTLPQIKWKYNYGIDVLFYAIREVTYSNAPVDFDVSQFVNYSTILQMILKESSFENALTDILCLPQGEKLVNVLIEFCRLPKKDIVMFESACSHYLMKEKEKLLLLNRIMSRKWPAQPFEVYILSREAGQFNVGRTSPVFERTFFIPFQKRETFTDSVTHELIHFMIDTIFEKDLFTDLYQRIIAQEVVVRLLDIHLNKALGRNENIFYKKIEMAALGYLSLFLSCLDETEDLMKKTLEPDDIKRVGSMIAEKCNTIRQKDINLSIPRILFENPCLIKNLLFDTVQYITRGC